VSGDYALYRYFEVGDRLLYIGKSGIMPVRETQHVARSKWMCLAVRSAIERYPTAQELSTAERRAIRAEHPLFNNRHNDPEARERLRAYLDEIGRPDLLPPERRRKSIVAQPARTAPALKITLGPGVSPEMAGRLDMFDLFSDPAVDEAVRVEAFTAYLRLGSAMSVSQGRPAAGISAAIAEGA
jgi:hypothetical protein